MKNKKLHTFQINLYFTEQNDECKMYQVGEGSRDRMIDILETCFKLSKDTPLPKLYQRLRKLDSELLTSDEKLFLDKHHMFCIDNVLMANSFTYKEL